MASLTELGSDLRLKLLWLSIFRMVTTTLLLGILAIRLLSAPRGMELSNEDSLSFVVIGAVYLMTLIYALALRTGQPTTWWAYVQLLGDVALATSLVYLTGGSESPFAFMYLLAIVAGSILLFQRGAFLTAAASAVAFCGLTVCLQLGLLKLPAGTLVLPPGRLAFVLGSNLLAQFLIAALAGYLSRQLWTTGGRLTARESDLRQLATFQKQILAAMPSGLVTSDGEGRVTFVNRVAGQILGVDCADTVGIPLDALIPGVVAIGAGSKRNTLDITTPEGVRTLGLSSSELDAPPGARLIVFQDLTELKRMEQELERADRLAALGKLSAQLAHEIRNPLAAMRGSAQMLSAQPDAAATARLATILMRESDRLAQLLEDFLRFARPPPPNRRPCDLKEVVTDTLEMLQADPLSQRGHTDTELESVASDIDPDQIRQVLVNLLRNAWMAAGPSGRVRVSVRGGDSAEIRVWDSAGSIPSGDLNRIFEPFFTTKSGGTGLGLSAAYSIARAHGGTIRVTSSAERGTEFTVVLTRANEAAVANPGR